MSLKHFSKSSHSGFYMIYAVLFIVSIGIACTFYSRYFYQQEQVVAYIHGKIQLQLYANTFKSMILLCLKERDYNVCEHQSLTFPPQYHFYSMLTRLDDDTILLDVYGYTLHPANQNIMRISKRYVLLRP